MKISLLSGAYKNAGDFLIVKRSKELLRYVYPECEIKEYERRRSIVEDLDEINHSDYLVLAGGPAYVKNMYPDVLPLVSDLDDIKVPFFALGLGWQGITAESDVLYQYQFTDQSMSLLHRIEEDGYYLGCRDLKSQQVLNNVGIKNTIMTGCVAWHNLEYVNKLEFRNQSREIRKICVSDPAVVLNFEMAYALVEYLKQRFSRAEIEFVFHRGTDADENTPNKEGKKIKNLKQKIESLGIQCIDISYSSDGFKIYDSCDLHIGFRVHAHIYNLSIRNKSVLIEEDSRGAGVNQALGIPSILAYEKRYPYSKNELKNKFVRHFCVFRNPYVIKELNDYLDYLETTDYMLFLQVYERMKYYFDQMIKHIKTLK